ncbi:glycosyl hydrolase family 17 protein [Ichthyenterobacterium sp. W332]|uniref:Endo-1,3-beta-glucanase btgC n=1 Tax=Microcosmobacter mediterraneus TaxID=3075607 RepID=A0ABU2YJW2_9FLAO|nr:glycosyl hydrolase family 17 protein [Ichthyenterobacterium sp. W332]MDT0558459.1 glycosyl hydrolase family 17 protein [Ichthyenterobacterium sp. W332]
MSYKEEKILALTAVDYDDVSIDGLKKTFKKVLKNGIHGLCFSPYMDGQEPGEELSEAQIRRRIEIIKPYTKWIRSFSCTEGNELIPKIAKEYGLNTLVGAWLGDDLEINDNEIKGLVELSNKGYVDVAAVGNEVMYRGDLTEEELINYIIRAKNEIHNVPIGYVDAYYEFSDRPAITEICDVILANCYPFWEGCDQDYSLLYMKDMYHRAKRAGNGKRVIITETGWPNEGTNLEGAFPSEANALKYFINAQRWSKEEGIEMFYFSSFDESWKVGAEGDVGAFWGIWDKNEKIKY